MPAKPSDRKTTPTKGSVATFLGGVADERRRVDAQVVTALMAEVTGAEPVLWGSSIIGFGRQPYTTADGRQHEWFAVGLSPRKASLTLYGLTYYGSNEDLLDQLGKHTTGKGCVYVRRLSDVDGQVLREMVARAWETNHVPEES